MLRNGTHESYLVFDPARNDAGQVAARDPSSAFVPGLAARVGATRGRQPTSAAKAWSMADQCTIEALRASTG
ncbi:hypothetical protein PPSIR1_10200 [Plesiocystis pacifica SIR-1]|uniref:Uncharacterized protein n=1 Tax=Plesiocystis pacifica SIR-1 TaxID=391625 RepID=A6GJ74_9BACT|nr:hypothetical protein PPSIR1_10200 [Plesiocystis pacifica SIR-1]